MAKHIRLLTALAAVTVLVTSLCGCGVFRDDTVYAPVSKNNQSSDGFYYDLYENGTAVISGCDNAAKFITVPEKIDGHTVTGIGDAAFRGLETVYYIKMGSNIKTIGAEAFAGCGAMVRIDLGGSVRNIGDGAFYNCALLSEVQGMESVESIGSSAFFQCGTLSFISLPESLRSVGEQAFFGCTSLTTVRLPSKGCTLGPGAFSYCDSLCRVDLGGISEIPHCAFEKCPMLTSIIISDRVTSIGESAFRACASLTDVTVGRRVAFIGPSAFEETPWLDSSKEEFLIVGEGVLLRYNGSAGNVVVPDSVRLVADAFCGNEAIRSVTIGGKANAIGDYAFSGCTGLNRVTVSGSVTSLGRYAFSQCRALTVIYLPATISSVSASAFAGCQSLGSVNYGGNAAAWNKISIDKTGNDYLIIATVNYSQKP